MISWAALKDDIFDWVDSLTASTIIWAEQMASQPAPPYITLKIISGPVKLGDELRFNTSNDKFFTAGLRQFTLSIQGFGTNALQDLTDILGALDDPDVFEDLKDKSLALVSTPSIIDLTQLLDTVFEERAALDLIFTTPDNRELTTTYISTVNITGDFDDGRVITDDTITLPS